jgi:ATP phosphoribosyltransferase
VHCARLHDSVAVRRCLQNNHHTAVMYVKYQLRKNTRGPTQARVQDGQRRGILQAGIHSGHLSKTTAGSLSKRAEEAELVKSTSNFNRNVIRMGVPSKGRMAEDTLELLKSCQLKCEKPNPRQYFGQIQQFPQMEVWFQRASDVVRKLRTGDLDIGIVGMDMFAEFAEEDRDLVVIHDALDFGQCKLALGVPSGGKFADVGSLDDLKAMGWSEAKPLRVVTGYTNIARRCFTNGTQKSEECIA